jgi:hypothetical protein
MGLEVNIIVLRHSAIFMKTFRMNFATSAVHIHVYKLGRIASDEVS